MWLDIYKVEHLNTPTQLSGTNSDVPAWAWSLKPAQAGPGKPSWAQAEYTAWEDLRLRLQILKAQAVGLSPVYIEFIYDQ